MRALPFAQQKTRAFGFVWHNPSFSGTFSMVIPVVVLPETDGFELANPYKYGAIPKTEILATVTLNLGQLSRGAGLKVIF